MGRQIVRTALLLTLLSACQGTENIDRLGNSRQADAGTADFAWRNILASAQFYEERAVVSLGSIIDTERATAWDGDAQPLAQTDACILSQIGRRRGASAGYLPTYEATITGTYDARWDQTIDYDACGSGQVTGRETVATQMATHATRHSMAVDNLRLTGSAGQSSYSGYATLETYLQSTPAGVSAGAFELALDNTYTLTPTDSSSNVLTDPIHTFVVARGGILSASSVGLQIVVAGWEQAGDAVYAQSSALVYDVEQCPFLVEDIQSGELLPVTGFPVMYYAGTITLDSITTGMRTEWIFQDCRMTILEDGEPVETLDGRDPGDQLVLLGGASSSGFGGVVLGRSLLRLPYIESSHVALLTRDWCRDGLCMQFDYTQTLDPAAAYPLALLQMRRYAPQVATAEQRGSAFNSLHVLGLATTASVDGAGVLTQLAEPIMADYTWDLTSADSTDTTQLWTALSLRDVTDGTQSLWDATARAERDGPDAAPSLRATRYLPRTGLELLAPQ